MAVAADLDSPRVRRCLTKHRKHVLASYRQGSRMDGYQWILGAAALRGHTKQTLQVIAKGVFPEQ